MLPAAIIMAIVFGVIYGLLSWYNPFIYITVVATLLCAWFFGLLASKLVVKIGKLRSLKVAIILGLLLAIILDYTQWIVWVDLAFNATSTRSDIGNYNIIALANDEISKELLNFALYPDFVWEYMEVIRSEGGVWPPIKSSSIHPLLLTVIWFLETLIFLMVTTVAFTLQCKEPFCETTNTWHEQELFPIIYMGKAQKILEYLEEGDKKWLDSIYIGEDLNAFLTLKANGERDPKDDTRYSLATLHLYTSDDRNNSLIKLEQLTSPTNPTLLHIDQKMYLALRDQIENGHLLNIEELIDDEDDKA